MYAVAAVPNLMAEYINKGLALSICWQGPLALHINVEDIECLVCLRKQLNFVR